VLRISKISWSDNPGRPVRWGGKGENGTGRGRRGRDEGREKKGKVRVGREDGKEGID